MTLKTLKDIINDNKKEGSSIDYLSIKQENINDKHRIPEELNKSFACTVTQLALNITAPQDKVLQII